jgi:hypothetical protein
MTGQPPTESLLPGRHPGLIGKGSGAFDARRPATACGWRQLRPLVGYADIAPGERRFRNLGSRNAIQRTRFIGRQSNRSSVARPIAKVEAFRRASPAERGRPPSASGRRRPSD